MKRSDGFLMIEVLMALGVLAVGLLAAGEALSAARLSVRRSEARLAMAACADRLLVMTLAGAGALTCDPPVLVACEAAACRLTVGNMTERFTGLSHAR